VLEQIETKLIELVTIERRIYDWGFWISDLLLAHLLPATNPKSVFLLHYQRYRIEAIPQTRWWRAILKNMAEVRIADIAEYFNPLHAVANVLFVPDSVGFDGFRKTGPSRAGVELGCRLKQVGAATHAGINAGVFAFAVLPGEGPLGSLLACHPVLFGGQLRPPFFVGFYYFLDHSCVSNLYEQLDTIVAAVG